VISEGISPPQSFKTASIFINIAPVPSSRHVSLHLFLGVPLPDRIHCLLHNPPQRRSAATTTAPQSLTATTTPTSERPFVPPRLQITQLLSDRATTSSSPFLLRHAVCQSLFPSPPSPPSPFPPPPPSACRRRSPHAAAATAAVPCSAAGVPRVPQHPQFLDVSPILTRNAPDRSHNDDLSASTSP